MSGSVSRSFGIGIMCACTWVHTRACHDTPVEVLSHGSQLSPSIMWVLEISLRSLASRQASSPPELSHELAAQEFLWILGNFKICSHLHTTLVKVQNSKDK